ncbi:glycosyltransferase family protein [Aestuariirhabdus sp. LZHN29]|uniref:glycosyltransferase family protein n=1 Tax=Aestuariirhabdus sp. LZHN29 TaxID=3417462 RepID=UPI003CEAB30C
MTQSIKPDARVLIYSHDSYGLGHLRRCHTIAHALVRHYKSISVLILTGSPIIGRFDFRARVDFVRIPGVIKLYDGDYTSLGLHIDLSQTLAIRESIIYNTALSFSPDIFLVDKEPLGLKGEVKHTLKMLKALGTTNVLGLRDVMDEAGALDREWQAKGIPEHLDALFDQVWVYGPESMGNPLEGVSLPQPIDHKMHYTGYLNRRLPKAALSQPLPIEQPYLLVTTGGGGDGLELVDWILRAYEKAETELPLPALIVLGPFMPSEEREIFAARAALLQRVKVITFNNHLEGLIAKAEAIVSMGGYNTFCEILSFNKPAIIVPRKTPRLEQYIRAKKAYEGGLIQMVDPDHLLDTNLMIAALKQLEHTPPPGDAMCKGMLNGIGNLVSSVHQVMSDRGHDLQPNQPEE